MFANDRLYRNRTCHGSLLAHQCCPCAESKACDVPKGNQGSGAHSMLDNVLLKGLEMVLLLIPHVLDGRTHGRILQHKVLPSVDPVSSQLTSVVDANDPVQRLVRPR